MTTVSGITVKQATTYARKFYMALSSDHNAPATGFGTAVVVNLSKGPPPSNSFVAAVGPVSEIGSGWYQVVYSPTDTGTLGDLAVVCTHATADQTNFVDQVQTQIFPDLALQGLGGGTARALVSSPLIQGQSFTALFFLTQLGTSNPAPGLTVAGQRTFGVGGFTNVSGTILEVGGAGNGAGWYVFNGLAADSGAPQAGFKMTSLGANDTDFSLWFQP